MQRDPALHAEQVAELRQMPSHMNKVTEPLNWVLCLVCSEDRVIEHYTQIKGLTRGQAIVQWVWHLLICEDDIFTFLLFFFCWEVARQAVWVIIACKRCCLYLSDSLFIDLHWKVELFEVSHFTGLQFSICVVIWVPQIRKKLFGSYFVGRLFSIPCLPSINFRSKLLRASITLSPVRNSEMFRIWLSKHQGLPSCTLSLWNCIFLLALVFTVFPMSKCSRMCYEMFEMMAMAAWCRLLAVFLTYLNACKSVSIIRGLFSVGTREKWSVQWFSELPHETVVQQHKHIYLEPILCNQSSIME